MRDFDHLWKEYVEGEAQRLCMKHSALRNVSFLEINEIALGAAKRLRAKQPRAGTEPRGINGVPGPQAFGDLHFSHYVYNDVSASLTLGMPLFVDIRDAAEYNTLNSTTAISPAVANSGGNVVLGTTAAGTGPNYICVGVFWPEQPGGKPSKGDTIRVQDRGRTIVSAEVYNAGTALKVGDVLIVDTTPGTSLVSGHNTPVLNQTVGVALATGTAVASQNTIQATGGGNVVVLANAFIKFA